MSDTNSNRPTFAERLRAGLNEAAKWTRGEQTLHGSEKVNGEWVETKETGPEFFARRAQQTQEEDTGILPIEYYAVRIVWSARDGAFLAEMPELPGCMADGATQEEALRHIREVARMWIETAQLRGRPIPQPEAQDIAA